MESLKSQSWFRVIPIVIFGRELYVDLIIMEMYDYDLILGMDWLTRYNAVIDYQKKKSNLPPSKRKRSIRVLWNH